MSRSPAAPRPYAARIALLLAVSGLCGLSAGARAQDSVGLTPGTHDALSSYDAAGQRVRYAVDLVPVTSSWNTTYLVAPLIKASRDTDPLFTTQIIGSAAVSPNLATSLAFAAENYAAWTAAPGVGVNPAANSPASTVPVSAFASQFGVALSDFSLSPSSVVGATVGRVSGQFTRLFVERTVAASSRPSPAGANTSTVSLGGVDALGNVMLRADNFNTSGATTDRLLGDNIVRVNLDARTAATINTLRASGSSNIANDAAASAFIISNETVPTNTPTLVNQPGQGAAALVYDFAARFRAGLSSAGLATSATHLPVGISGHRGNPAFSTTTVAGGPAGTVASLALPTSGTRVNTIMAFGLSFGAAGAAPSVTPGTPRAFTLPQPIAAPGFSANTAGTAQFLQYLSQTPFRGGNGQVGVGQTAANELVLAAVATDPTAGDFIAAVRAPQGGSGTWSIPAFPGAPVRDALNGTTIGALGTSNLRFSSPAVDRLGNIYFIAQWTPNLLPTETALFKAVNTASGYQLEALLRTGQQIAGANSGRTYTITSLALTDSDSVASAAAFSQSVIQQQDPAATTTNPALSRAFGGMVVAAVITYNNAGVNEAYDALLYVGPTAGADCLADFNGAGGITVQDIFDFLAAYFSGNIAADVNSSGNLTVQDIFDFLSLYFSGC